MPSHISPPSLPVGLVRQPLWNFSAHPWLLRHTGTLGRLNSNAVQNGERPKQIINSTKNATIDSRASEILGWFIQIGTCPLYFDGHQTFVRMGVLSGRHFVRTGLDVLSGPKYLDTIWTILSRYLGNIWAPLKRYLGSTFAKLGQYLGITLTILEFYLGSAWALQFPRGVQE